jgi:hypothetical protein
VLDALIGATYTRGRDSMLANGNLGLERLRFFMRPSRDLRLLDGRRYEHAARALDEVGRLVGGWIKARSKTNSRPVLRLASCRRFDWFMAQLAVVCTRNYSVCGVWQGRSPVSMVTRCNAGQSSRVESKAFRNTNERK